MKNNEIKMQELIKKAKEKNITIQEISLQTGYSRASIWRYFRGIRTPRIDFVNALNKLVG